ncbi:hypothetical protein [Nocardia sp. NPDC127526]
MAHKQEDIRAALEPFTLPELMQEVERRIIALDAEVQTAKQEHAA